MDPYLRDDLKLWGLAFAIILAIGLVGLFFSPIR
jgi:hypothetical protein